MFHYLKNISRVLSIGTGGEESKYFLERARSSRLAERGFVCHAEKREISPATLPCLRNERNF